MELNKMAEKTHCESCDRNFPSPDALAMHNSAKHPISQVEKTSHKKTLFIVIIIAVLLIAGGFLFFQNKSVSGNTINNPEIQKITLSMNGNYNPNTITVKAGVPVEITLDNTIKGCYRNFNIPSLGVSQSSLNPSDIIKFTPTEKGTFNFRCSMGMGTGTIIVD